MQVTVARRDQRPLYVQIVDQVRRAPGDGNLQAEDQPPSVRDLAGQLVIDPRTALQAYQQLESERAVCVRRGQRKFVAPTISPDRRHRRALVPGVAERASTDARRNGLAVEELVTMIVEAAAEEEKKNRPALDTPDSIQE